MRSFFKLLCYFMGHYEYMCGDCKAVILKIFQDEQPRSWSCKNEKCQTTCGRCGTDLL